MTPSKSITVDAIVVYNVFVDANVIAKWLSLSGLSSIKKTTREKREFLEHYKDSKNKHLQKLYYSYEFIEKFVCNDVEKNRFRFMYSPLVMTEVLNVLFELYVYEYMQRNTIPSDEFYVLRKEKFDEGTYAEIYLANKELFEKLEGFMEMAIEDKKLFGIAGLCISEYGVKSQDAHLIAQATFNGCKYFVTNDGDLLSKFNEENHKEKAYPIAIFPNNFMQKFTSENKTQK